MGASGGRAKIDNKLNRYPELQPAYDLMRFSEPLIVTDLEDIAKQLQSKIAGENDSVITASEVERRLERTNSKLSRGIHYTEVVSKEDLVQGVRETIKELKDKGYRLLEMENNYHASHTASAKAIRLEFVSPYGRIFEIQMHSPESLHANKEIAALEEKMRLLSTDEKAKEMLLSKIESIREYNTPVLPEYRDLSDYRMPKYEKEEYIRQLPELKAEIERAQISKDAEAISYRIVSQDQTLLYGVENHHSDGSVFCLKTFYSNPHTMYESYDPDGNLVLEQEREQVQHLSIEQASHLLVKTEDQHQHWLSDEPVPDRSAASPVEKEQGKNQETISRSSTQSNASRTSYVISVNGQEIEIETTQDSDPDQTESVLEEQVEIKERHEEELIEYGQDEAAEQQSPEEEWENTAIDDPDRPLSYILEKAAAAAIATAIPLGKTQDHDLSEDFMADFRATS